MTRPEQDQMVNTQALLEPLFQHSFIRHTDSDAIALIRQGLAAFDMALAEERLAKIACQADWDNTDQGIAPISKSAWHLEQALWRYREAIIKFQQAKGLELTPVFKAFVDLKIAECIKECRSLQRSSAQRDLSLKNMKKGETASEQPQFQTELK